MFDSISDGDDSMMRESEEHAHEGNGIITTTTRFLPGDIKGLEDKLCYLLAEFQAGNTTTSEEIVPISDELLRRKKISRQEYKDINNFLQQQK